MQRTKKAVKRVITSAVLIFVFVSSSFAWADFKTIDTVQLHSMVVDNAYSLEGGRQKQFTVIDARTKEEYDEGHIASAISIPENCFEKSINLLPKDKGTLLVVYCKDAKFETSRKWAGKAAAAGYTNLSIYSEGFSVWKDKKMPVAPLRNSL
jgi:rhodanese-related sulfurtransferase